MLLEQLRWERALEEPDSPDHLYRAWVNSEGNYVYFTEHQIIKRTPQGAHISQYDFPYESGDPTRFVRLTARKQWASETRREAVRQLYHRMRRWQRFLARDLKRAQTAEELLRSYA